MNIKRGSLFIFVILITYLIATKLSTRYGTRVDVPPLSSVAHASAFLQSKPLVQIINQADVVVVAEVVNYTKDINWKAPDVSVEAGTLKMPGEYTFRVLRVLKGRSDSNLQLKLPVLLNVYYDSAKLEVEDGNQVLLFLKSEDDTYSPVDSTIPLTRLADNDVSKLPRGDDDVEVTSRVISLLTDSLLDPTIRTANTYLLRQVVDARLPKELTPYLDDPNWRTQDNILYCLIINQQIDAIALIAKFETKRNEAGSGSRAVTVLDSFKTPAAVPFLNPLLWKPAYFLRLNATSALINLPDRSSIPYFVLALRDPDPQNYIPYSAYSMLYKLIPDLGTPKDWQLFQVQRETASRPLYAWWTDELSGKHLKPLNTRDQPQMSQIEISTLPLDKLNSLLFNPVTSTRQKAMDTLVKRVDKSSIPYLILALIDPDTTVSYDAYVTLHRLIPTLGTPKSSTEFRTNTEAATHPIYLWWEDELNGNHLPVPKLK